MGIGVPPVELNTLAIGLATFLVSAVLMTLLGFGGATGNNAGLLFWVVIAALPVAYLVALSRRGDESEAVKLTRRWSDGEHK